MWSQNRNLTIVVENVKEANGQIVVALFTNEEDFLTTPWKSKVVAVSNINNTTAHFEGLPEGDYAVSIFHDINTNMELDKNFFGVPKEGFGFSNNKMGTFGPPSFTESTIKLDSEKTEIIIRLKHF